MSEPRCIDVRHLGRAHVIGCWEVDGVLVDPGPASCLDTLLTALDGREPRALLLTHVHLDHAGASGSLVERYPDLPVYVHERGYPHMARPEKLWQSASRLYGDDMERLWGEMKPVPEANLHSLSGGETVLDAFEVEYTPGHASHHVTYFRDGVAYCGDVAGVRIPPAESPIPPTPPPDIDIEAWHASIDLVAARRPSLLALTHWGGYENVEQHLGDLSRRLDAWAAIVRDEGEMAFLGKLANEVEATSAEDLETVSAFTQAAPPDQLYQGLARYWSKRSA